MLEHVAIAVVAGLDAVDRVVEGRAEARMSAKSRRPAA